MGLVDKILGKNKKQNESVSRSEKYAEEFKSLWENDRFEDAAKLLMGEWVEYDKSLDSKDDKNFAYATIIVNATLFDSVPTSQLKSFYENLNLQPNNSKLAGWYRLSAKVAIDVREKF